VICNTIYTLHPRGREHWLRILRYSLLVITPAAVFLEDVDNRPRKAQELGFRITAKSIVLYENLSLYLPDHENVRIVLTPDTMSLSYREEDMMGSFLTNALKEAL